MKSLAKVIVCLLAAHAACADSGKPVLPEHPRYGLQHLDDRLGLNTRTVSTFLQDRAGFLWIGTQTGLLRFDGSKVTQYGREQGLLTEVVAQLALAPDGKLWVGSEMGLARFDGASFQAVQLPLSDLKINSNYQLFAMDWQGGVFIASASGLLRFDYDNPAQYRLWTTKQGLPSNSVEAVYAAGNGALYFVAGDRVGILRSRQNKPELLPGYIGAAAERIVAVLVDGQGVVWVRSSSHLRRYDISSAQFVAEDAGIPKANDFGGPSLDRGGKLMLPTVTGLYFRDNGGWKNFGE